MLKSFTKMNEAIIWNVYVIKDKYVIETPCAFQCGEQCSPSHVYLATLHRTYYPSFFSNVLLTITNLFKSLRNPLALRPTLFTLEY